jgi:large subunit ribosomal protein L28
MAVQCAVTGKTAGRGYKYARRGKAKYLGGVGKKVTGKTRRTFKPNLQTVKAEINGQVKRIRVSVSAIRSGLVKRAVKRKPFQMQNV